MCSKKESTKKSTIDFKTFLLCVFEDHQPLEHSVYRSAKNEIIVSFSLVYQSNQPEILWREHQRYCQELW